MHDIPDNQKFDTGTKVCENR